MAGERHRIVVGVSLGHKGSPNGFIAIRKTGSSQHVSEDRAHVAALRNAIEKRGYQVRPDENAPHVLRVLKDGKPISREAFRELEKRIVQKELRVAS